MMTACHYRTLTRQVVICVTGVCDLASFCVVTLNLDHTHIGHSCPRWTRRNKIILISILYLSKKVYYSTCQGQAFKLLQFLRGN